MVICKGGSGRFTENKAGWWQHYSKKEIGLFQNLNRRVYVAVWPNCQEGHRAKSSATRDQIHRTWQGEGNIGGITEGEKKGRLFLWHSYEVSVAVERRHWHKRTPRAYVCACACPVLVIHSTSHLNKMLAYIAGYSFLCVCACRRSQAKEKKNQTTLTNHRKPIHIPITMLQMAISTTLRAGHQQS